MSKLNEIPFGLSGSLELDGTCSSDALECAESVVRVEIILFSSARPMVRLDSELFQEFDANFGFFKKIQICEMD